MTRACRILRVDRWVTELQRSAEFYCAALGFRIADWPGDGTPKPDQIMLARATQHLLLHLAPPGAAMPRDILACDQGFQHIALPVTDMDAAMRGLTRFAPRMLTQGGPQRLPAASGGVIAVKFCDPDGHPVEFLQFPDARAGGIDHSAIVVTDAERSMAFYRNLLGLQVTSRQANTGPEQDRLDGLNGVNVDVVALAPAIGTPHVELLGYRNPPVRANHPALAFSTRFVFQIEGGASELLHDPDGHELLLQPN